MDKNLSDIANKFLVDLDTLAPHQSLASWVSEASLETGYIVQDLLIELMKAREYEVFGWKVALTNIKMQQMLGINHPLSGAVFDKRVHESPAKVDLSQHRHLGVEFEIAIGININLLRNSQPYTRDNIIDFVDSLCPALELIEDRDADYTALNTFDLAGENSWNAGVVLGASLTDWRSIDFENAETRLEVNGEIAATGKTGDAMGNPLESLVWLANHLNERGRSLDAGQFVMTGSSILTYFPEPGDDLTFTVDGCLPIYLKCI